MRTIALDSQILNTVSACARKVNLEFLQNWRPTEKAEALEKGDLMHRMLRHLYQSKKDGRKDMIEVMREAEAIARVISVDMDLSDSTVEENIMQFKAYSIWYASDGWVPLEIEKPFSKVLYRREDAPGQDGLQILYEGVIDLIVETPHGVFVADHKTASRRSTPSKLSNQFMGYAWATESLNIVVNRIGFQKTLGEAERFQRIFLSYNTPLLDEWTEQAVYWTKMLVSYIDSGYFPPNFTSCDKYAGCIFEGVCTAIPDVREFKLMTNFYVGDPWSPHTRDAVKE